MLCVGAPPPHLAGHNPLPLLHIKVAYQSYILFKPSNPLMNISQDRNLLDKKKFAPILPVSSKSSHDSVMIFLRVRIAKTKL